MSDHLELLRATPLFASLPRGVVERIAEGVVPADVTAGVAVVTAGDIGDAFYVIAEGTFEVLMDSPSGGPPGRAAELGPGDWFGEMALITGEPRSATVRALTTARVLRLARDEFERLAPDPSVHRQLLAQLCSRLRDVEARLHGEQTARLELGKHIRTLHRRSSDQLVGTSEPSKKLAAAIAAAGKAEGNVLVLGPSGSGKSFVAALIAGAGSRAEGPLLEVDCATAGEAAAQELFGAEAQATGTHRRLGALELCADGTVVVSEPGRLADQPRLLQALQTGWFYRLGGAEPVRLSARIIVTQRTAGSKGEEIDPGLVALFAGGCVRVPSLRERKRDIESIARVLLERHCLSLGVGCPGLTKGAIERLVSYPWPGNVEEINAVMRRAVALATEGQIESDHIVIHLPSVQPEARIDLFRVPWIIKFVRSKAYPLLLQLPTAAVLGWIAYLCFFGPNDDTNLALTLTWPVWWAMLPLTFILAGRFWCSLCPFALVSSVMQRAVSLRLKVPQLFRRLEIWPMTVLFVFLTWADEYWHYPDFPRLTGIILVAVFGGTLLMSFLFERRVWCRSFCPLGGVNGVYSTAALAELRPSTDVCAGACKGHECVAKDSPLACPMLERPMVLDNNRSCNLCMNCVKACPNGAMHLYVRFPGAEIWQQRQPIASAGILAALLAGVMLLHGVIKCLEANGGSLTTLPVLDLLSGGQDKIAWTIAYFAILALSLFGVLFTSAISAALEGGNWKTNIGHYGLAFAVLAVFFHVALEGATFVGDGIPKLLALAFRPLGGDARPEAYALLTPLATLFAQMGLAAIGILLTVHVLRKVAAARQADGMGKLGNVPHALSAGMLGLVFLLCLWSSPVAVLAPEAVADANVAAATDTAAGAQAAGQPAPPAGASAPTTAQPAPSFLDALRGAR